jgi:hypothetical protein
MTSENFLDNLIGKNLQIIHKSLMWALKDKCQTTSTIHAKVIERLDTYIFLIYRENENLKGNYTGYSVFDIRDAERFQVV